MFFAIGYLQATIKMELLFTPNPKHSTHIIIVLQTKKKQRKNKAYDTRSVMIFQKNDKSQDSKHVIYIF